MTARVSVDRIKATVAADYGVPIAKLTANQRHLRFVRPRHVAIYLACNLTDHSSGTIGRLFGGRDHSTIYNAHRKIAEAREADAALSERISRLEQELSPPRSLPAEIQLAMFDGPLFDWRPESIAA